MVRNLITATAFLNWISGSPALRGIRRRRRICVDVQGLCGVDVRRIAIAIAVVICRTTRRNRGPFWRLGVLPYVSKANTAVDGTRRALGKEATGRGRTGIVRDPIHDLSCAGILADIVGSDDILATFFCSGNARAVDAGPKAACGDSIDPRIDVGFLLGQHAAALLLIKENRGSRRESFPPCRRHSRLRVGLAEFARVRNRLQLIEQASVEQYQESESC